jgi:hypothetical protein
MMATVVSERKGPVHGMTLDNTPRATSQGGIVRRSVAGIAVALPGRNDGLDKQMTRNRRRPLSRREDLIASCAPLANAAVEIWQCDADGHYSEYAQPSYDGTGQTFLRGLQLTDGAGQATFITVYPGWYQGRATHIHVEVYVNGRSIKLTQIAFPDGLNAQVYASGVYASRGGNPIQNAADTVFSDGHATELATVTDNAGSGLTATLTLGVQA